MKSFTKHKQSQESIARMVELFFAPFHMKHCRELTEGYFNVAYEICLDNGKEVILKIAPLKEMRVMTYEKNIMFAEVEAMKRVRLAGGIPVPAIIPAGNEPSGCEADIWRMPRGSTTPQLAAELLTGYDDSCTICASPYFFMDKLEGRSLHVEKDSLTADQIAAIYTEVGRINRKINEISCPCFGYPGQKAFQGEAWFPVFQKMLEAGIEDARNGNVDLKIPIDRLRSRLQEDKAIFEEVTQPRLVHWDCWDGNIFVKAGQVEGIIDWERSLWGDPLMEVGFRTYADNTCFLQGYGRTGLTEEERRRALWYDIYLLILVSLECEYRSYETLDMYNWATGLLGEQFKKL